MQSYLSAILRLQMNHSQIIQNILDSLIAAEELMDQEISSMNSGTDTSKVGKLEECTATIIRDLSEHLRFEEQEVMPTIVEYAEEIINIGLRYEHEKIRFSIAELGEEVNNLVAADSDREALLSGSTGIIAKLHDIRDIVEEHAEKQNAILELAHLTLKSLQSKRDKNL